MIHRYNCVMTQIPTCLIVTGPPASGKSTLAQQLTTLLNWPLVGRDVIREQAVHTEGRILSHAEVNQRFVDEVNRVLNNGTSLVCEAAFQHHVWNILLAQISVPHTIKLLTCHVPARLRIERIHQRMAADATRTEVHADGDLLAAYASGVVDPEAFVYLSGPWPHMAVECQHGYQPVIDNVIAWIRD